MYATTLSTAVKGRYFWELVFSYDNSRNTGDITDKTTITKRKTVNAKEFMSNKFNVNTGFKYENQASTSLKFDGMGESDTSTFTFHTDLAYELVKTSETATTIDEETKTERSYTVAGGGKLDLYRLCYVSDGASITTDIVSTSPKADVFVDMKFSCRKSILGLADMLSLLAHTVPGSSNRNEWEAIRNNIVQYSDRGEEDAFKHLVETLKTITPGTDNVVEWQAIRTTCGEILDGWTTTDKQLLFKKLLTRFSTTNPGRDNKDEWERIRDLSDKILGGITQVF